MGLRFGCNRGARRLPKTANKFPWRIGQLGWSAVLITPNIRFLAADAVRRGAPDVLTTVPRRHIRNDPKPLQCH